MANARILVVDDEEDLCEILKFNLEIEGFDVDTANSAEEALKKDLSVYQLLMLDVMMGEISGFKMANIIRKDESKPKVPIIFLTAKDTENDRLTGFNLGADDYISKPFSIREVMARVKAVLRRTAIKNEEDKETISFEDLIIDIPKKKVSIGNEEITLTKKEFEILLYLAKHFNEVVPREDLLNHVWGSHDAGLETRTIDMHIKSLRKKLNDDSIQTIYGIGYKIG